jgi:thiol-disulfide isomerase/thioredoxin
MGLRITIAAFSAVGLVLAACGQPQTAQPALAIPVVQVATLEDLPTPLPLPYDEGASAEEVNAEIDAAFERARAGGKRVIIDMGGNWCGWCRGLAGVMDLPEVAPFIEENFEVVFVGVSATQGGSLMNREVVQRFGMEDIPGVPWLVIAEPDGTILHSSYEVTDEDHETPQAMVDWLAGWAPQREEETVEVRPSPHEERRYG